MEVPLEQMPQPARGRIESLMKTVAARTSIKEAVKTAELVATFYTDTPFFHLAVEKQVGDGTIEAWVVGRLERGSDWIDDTAMALYLESLETREVAVEAQLCSATGKSVPADFELSEAEAADAWDSAQESAVSIAETYNKKLASVIETVKEKWYRDHGDSFIGLNRFTLLKLVEEQLDEFDDWKVVEIAATEFSTQWQAQTLSFWVQNKGDAELEYFLAPATASDPDRDTPPICLTYAGRWLSAKDAGMFPAHVNCIHYVSRTRVKSGALPFHFIIGGVTYEVADLADC